MDFSSNSKVVFVRTISVSSYIVHKLKICMVVNLVKERLLDLKAVLDYVEKIEQLDAFLGEAISVVLVPEVGSSWPLKTNSY